MEQLILQATQWREHLAFLVYGVAAYVAIRCLWAGYRAAGRQRRRLWACGFGAALLTPFAASPALGILPAGMVVGLALLAAGTQGSARWRQAIPSGIGLAVLAGATGLLLAGRIPMLGMGPSMWPTTGKHLSMFFMKPVSDGLARGDQIDFHVPMGQSRFDEAAATSGWPGGRYHKRIVGLEGDHVVMDDYTLTVNGQQVADCRPGADTPRLSATTWLCDAAIDQGNGRTLHYTVTWGVPGIWMDGRQEWRLGSNQILVMGDNLVASGDSRQRGAIPADWVVGVVIQ